MKASHNFASSLTLYYGEVWARDGLVSVMVGAKNNSDIAVRGMAFYLKGKGMEVPVIFSDIPLRY